MFLTFVKEHLFPSDLNLLNMNGLFQWILLTLLAIILLYNYIFGTKKNLPPGPWGLPIVGHLPWLSKKPHITIERWSRYYGDVMGLRFGGKRVVVVSDINSLKSCLLDKWQDFGSRPNFVGMKMISDGKSVFARDATLGWKILRKIMKGSINSVMKSSQDQKSAFEEKVMRTAENISERLINKSKEDLCKEKQPFKEISPNKPEDLRSFDPREILYEGMIHLLFSICFGEANRDFDDLPEYKQAQKRIVNYFNGGHVQDFFPWMKHFSNLENSDIKKDIEFGGKIVKEQQTKYIQEYDKQLHGSRDFMGNLLEHVYKRSTIDSTESAYSNEEVQSLTGEFIGAGLFTSNGWLSWFLYFIARYPHMQERAFTEISQTIGLEESVRPHDRDRLPYTEALLWESFRYATAMPFLIPHAAKNDTHINGYDISKGTIMFVNAWALSRDSRLWDNPHEFLPERFLESQLEKNKVQNLSKDNGRLRRQSEHKEPYERLLGTDNLHLRRDKIELLVPFGLGARRCVGEPMGRTQVFIIAVTILQRCQVVLKSGPTEDEELNALGGETPFFRITVIERIKQ